VPPWEPGGTYKADDLREHGGVVYRCIQPHTNYDPGHTPNLTPSLWTPQG
jgi:chitin-binding protein